ncbi:MAG TPA: hypothetical protein VMB48_14420 [Steroidobacteraceae bacterium]|nr:hypothetical protein [Steroidobacteraceae bacterium]
MRAARLPVAQLGPAPRRRRSALPEDEPLLNLDTFAVDGPGGDLTNEDIDRTLRVEWLGILRFEATKRFYRRYSDHRFSFTDCTSIVVMRELGISEVLTTDRNFQEAGFQVL